MTFYENSLLLIDLVLWGALLALRSVNPQPSTLSLYELKRRTSAGFADSAIELRRHTLLPRIVGLKWLAESVTLVVAIALLTQLLSPFWVVIGGVGLLLAIDRLSKTTRMQQWIDVHYKKTEPRVLNKVEGWSWLRWFSSPEMVSRAQISSREELSDSIAKLSSDIVSKTEKSMLLSQLEYGKKRVSDVMTPRSMVELVSVKDTIGPVLLDRLHRSGHSRFPVIDEDIDHVVGMLYLHELVGKKGVPDTVKKAMHAPVHYVAAGRDLEHALHAFLHSHHHLFIVVNEYRETVGVLALEDVIETVIGRRIVDEFDQYEDLRAVAAMNPKSNNDPEGRKDI